MKRLSAVLAVLLLASLISCKKTDEAPRQKPFSQISMCYLQDLKLGPSNTATFTVEMAWYGTDATRPTGDFTLDVLHSEPWNPDPAKRTSLPASTRACSAKGPLVATAWKYDPTYHAVDDHHQQQLAIVSAAFDKACDPNIADGRVVKVVGGLVNGDDSYAGCELVGPVPAGLGGHDLSSDEQATALFRKGAQATKPAQYAAIRAYLASLATALSGIDPSVAPKTTVCPAGTTGEAPLFSYEEARAIATPLADAGALKPPALVPEAFVSLVPKSKLGSSLGGSLDLPAENIDDVASKLTGVSKFAIVETTIALDMPKSDVGERIGSYDRQGTYTPGSFSGAIFVLDRETGKVLCGAPVTARGSSDELRVKTSEIYQAIVAGLRSAVHASTVRALLAIAPGLKDAL